VSRAPAACGTISHYRYLQAQGLVNVPTYVLFIVSPLNLVFNYLFVRCTLVEYPAFANDQVWGPQALRLGFVGGAVATSLSYTLTVSCQLCLVLLRSPSSHTQFILSTTWAVFYGPREAFHPLTFKSTFSKLGTVTSLGLAGTIMVSDRR
jgi:MATE family multidrug resistance protein